MKWILLLVVLTQLSCSQTKKKTEITDLQVEQDEVIAEFERANRFLDVNKSEEAALIYDSLLLKYPGNQLDVVITYNAGIAYLNVQECDKASERFRKVIRTTAQKKSAIRSRATLRMSDVYTCLGEDNKAITNLVELFIGKHDLPIEILKAEIPAKLAAAYARAGNNKEAEKYFKIAEKGLLQVQLNYSVGKQKIESLGRTLFLMGNISQISTLNMNSDDYFITVSALQKYLYKAVEMNDKEWSPQAAAQIKHAYENVWDYIKRVRESEQADPGIAAREMKSEQLRIAQSSLIAILKLYDERIPDPQAPLVVTELLQAMKHQEIQLRNFISTNIVGTDLTPEALSAEALKRAGQVLNPDPILERQAQKRKLKGKTKK